MNLAAKSLITIAFAWGTASAFVRPDTVYIPDIEEIATWEPLPFITNTGSDSLIVDSISARMHARGEEAQVLFWLVLPAPDTMRQLYAINYTASNATSQTEILQSGSGRMAIPAGKTLVLNELFSSYCPACPFVGPGGPLDADVKTTVFFHSGSTKDSVLFLKRLGNTSVRRSAVQRREVKTYELFDLSGRKVVPPHALPGVLTVPKR